MAAEEQATREHPDNMGKTERQTARRHNCTGLQAAGLDAIPYASAATEHAIACTVLH